MINNTFQRNKVTAENIHELCNLAVLCFKDDHFYDSIIKNKTNFQDKLYNIYWKSINICMNYGHAYYYKKDNNIIGFALWFDYWLLKKTSLSDYYHIFPIEDNSIETDIINRHRNVIDDIIGENTNYMYLLSIGVHPSFRRQGIASMMISDMLQAYPQYNIFTDLSNLDSKKIYEKLGFSEIMKSEGCILMRYLCNQSNFSLGYDNKINLLLPKGFNSLVFLEREIEYEGVVVQYLKSVKEEGEPYFVQSLYDYSEGYIISVNYDELLCYQRYINVLYSQEIFLKIGDKIVVTYTFPEIDSLSCINDNLKDTIFSVKQKEHRLIPDIFVSIPVSYADIKILEEVHSKNNNININYLLNSMSFRTNYESGADIDALNTRRFKERIHRFYLGNIEVQIKPEDENLFSGKIDNYNFILDNPVEIGMIIAVDELTNIGVLHLVSFSCEILLTQLLDTISRNQLYVKCENEFINLYDFIKSKFRIEKKGGAKSLVTLPVNRSNVDNDLLASILFCETYYDSNESLGTVVDKEIIEILNDKYGIAQYNYACVYAYTNVLLQLSEHLSGSILERINTESITLFYIELIVFEEAAINITNDLIVDFLTKLNYYVPDDALKEINRIISNHSKSIEFWDLQLNYPSSRKSIENIRKSFKINKLIETLERNREQIIMIYQTRSDIIDRKEAAILSAVGIVLAGISSVEAINNCGDSIIFYVVTFFVIFLLFIKRMFLRKEIRNKNVRK